MAVKSLHKYVLPIKQLWHNNPYAKINSDTQVNTKNGFKTTIIGACGRLGQALAFELKKSASIETLALYDIKNSRSVALDLCHINTSTRVNHFYGKKAFPYALQGSSIVIITAGTPRFGPNITEKELFESNVPLITRLAKACVTYCPDAFVVLATSPVNMLVPVMCELTDNAHKQTKVFGLSSVNNMKTRAVLARKFDLEYNRLNEIKIPMYGGNCEDTIMPFLSQADPLIKMTENERKTLAEEIRKSSTSILRAYKGQGSSVKTNSLMAASFINSLSRCIMENCTIEESAYIYCDVIHGLNYGVTPFTMDKKGVKAIMKPPTNIPEEENCEFQQAIANLKQQVNKAENYIRHNLQINCKKNDMLKS